MSKKISYLPYVFFLALLPAMIFRDFSPANELRYLSIADEAIKQGHLFAFTNHGWMYADKPPLYLWIIMLGKMIFGRHCMWFLSLFSFVPAMVILRVMDRWMRNILPLQARFTGNLMLMSCGLFLCLSLFLRMDMLMCMFITLALYSFWKTYTSPDGRSVSIWFPVFIFLAIFTKGPIGFLVPFISTVAFLLVKRQAAMIRRFWGWKTWGVLLTLCGLWFFMVWREGGSPYLCNLLFHQTVDRAFNAFHHKEPFYYYLVVFWYLLAPWSLLIVSVYATAFKQHVKINEEERFFLTSIVTAFVILSLISSKIEVYLLPIFPYFVYLTVSLMQRIRENVWTRLSMIIPSLIFTLAPVFLAIAISRRWMGDTNRVLCILAAISFFASGVYALWLLRKGGTLCRQVNSLACGIFVALFLFGFAVSGMNTEWGYGDLCQKAKEVATMEHRQHYYSYGIPRSENMDVFLGKDVKEVSAQDILTGKSDDGVLMIRAKRLKHDLPLKHYVESHKYMHVGRNLIIEE
jgi:4-amino-4-deoxy-L-arabinose transferase-like glycosyltransferase